MYISLPLNLKFPIFLAKDHSKEILYRGNNLFYKWEDISSQSV